MSLRDHLKILNDQSWVPSVDEQPEVEQHLTTRPSPREEQIELTPGYDGYYPDDEPSEHLTEQSQDKSPLAVLDDIKFNPAPKGAYPTIIGGRPVDLHILEDYLLKISPYALKTVMRYHQARNIEELRRYGKHTKGGFNSKLIMWILIAAGLAGVGIFILFFMPNIANMLGGMFGSTGGP